MILSRLAAQLRHFYLKTLENKGFLIFHRHYILSANTKSMKSKLFLCLFSKSVKVGRLTYAFRIP